MAKHLRVYTKETEFCGQPKENMNILEFIDSGKAKEKEKIIVKPNMFPQSDEENHLEEVKETKSVEAQV